MRDIDPRYHTAEHILTGAAGSLFGGIIVDSRFKDAKCRADYRMPSPVDPDPFARAVTAEANRIIDRHLDVTFESVTPQQAARRCTLHRIPSGAAEIRLVKVGDEVVTPCVGMHVANTCDIGGHITVKTITGIAPDTVRIMFGITPADQEKGGTT